MTQSSSIFDIQTLKMEPGLNAWFYFIEILVKKICSVEILDIVICENISKNWFCLPCFLRFRIKELDFIWFNLYLTRKVPLNMKTLFFKGDLAIEQTFSTLLKLEGSVSEEEM